MCDWIRLLIGLIAILIDVSSTANSEENDRGCELRKPVRTLTLAKKVLNVSLSPDGKALSVWGDYRDKVTLRDTGSGRINTTLDLNADLSSCFEFSPNGQFFAAVNADATIHVWSIETGTKQTALNTQAEHGDVFSMAFSHDGKMLASGGRRNGTVIVWEVTTGRKLKEFPGEYVRALAFSPDGKLLATGDTAGETVIWDWRTGEQIRKLDASPSFTDIASYLAFLGDNKTLISCRARFRGYGYQFYGLQFWDITTGEKQAEFATERSALRLAVSADEHMAAVATGERHKCYRIVVFDLEQNRPIDSFPAHTDYITGLHFSPSGQQLISASRDGTVKHWDLSAVTKGTVLDERK